MLTNIVGSMVRFEAIQPGLQSRVFSTGSDNFSDFNLIGITQRGGASVLMENDQFEVAEFAVFCIPHKKKARVILPAGSQLWLLGYSDALTSLMIGSDLDSSKLAMLMRQLTITSSQKEEIEELFLPLLKLLQLEIGVVNKRSRTIICSIIRILLINTYRLNPIDTLHSVYSSDELVLQQFRQIVEIEFRNRRPVSYYCQELIMTYDRLHAICQRNLKKSPLQLINNRVLIEAISKLKKSTDSVQMIANALGYNEGSQLSHFIKKETGFSPSQIRHNFVKSGEASVSRLEQDFADWP
ncbi:helix-turn-helix domain-containing protein [Marinomonas arenicola]|uniref:helix-turn-helix domain-containing protein n=1 Tax=Marinomonas arenicola TaxID=569601 RepID=UPI00311E22C3